MRENREFETRNLNSKIAFGRLRVGLIIHESKGYSEARWQSTT